MGLIIKPYSINETATPFLDLSDTQKTQITLRFIKILKESFLTDERRKGKEYRQRVHTQAEERRRGMILMRWFRTMCGDLGYSTQKALDLLPRALRTELDGGNYEPPPYNRLWTPEGVIQ